MLRRLTVTESDVVAARINWLCTVRGGVDEGLLVKAVDVVVDGMAPLRARLGRDEHGLFLHQPEVEAPGLILGTGSVEDELEIPVGPEGPLVRVALLPGAEEDIIAVGVSHSIADGRSVLAIMKEIWRVYTALVEGTEVPIIEADIPESALAGLAHWTADEVAAHVERRRAEVVRVPHVPFEPAIGDRPEVTRMLIDRDTTARIAAGARAGGTSMHGLIAAALLLAARAEIGTCDELGFVSSVDMRPRLVPPLPEDAITPCSGWFFDRVDVHGGDPLMIARGINERLSLAVSSGVADLDLLAYEQLRVDPGFRDQTTVSMNNLGRIPAPRLPRGLRMTDLRTFVSVASRFRPDVDRDPLPASVLTFDGRLEISIPHRPDCFGQVQVARILDHVRTTLTGCAA
ncbi:hypothetical protein Lesp02_12670 [Lentzea sp. NBRC 105346]|uniref:phthiocerol/phthiodiolone dimycocerosyl transferase family protein n=1 Tax=Lentzea sp. NBRC 105346 TaxID=3032205 RepID=UPI0024A387E7|nr:hypothetical protein [Lentzea sp. NBRC 105346]GLZ29077.1 hypothetical protein Lesp02_12670 [Lentzea sp. NBRC 105346]